MGKKIQNAAKAGKLARKFYSKGYNCAKSVYMATCMARGKKPDRAILKACSAFGGGISRSGSVCGALVGAELALAEITGTTGKGNRKAAAYSARMFSKFKKMFGAVDCRELNGNDFSSEAHARRCGRIVARTSSEAAKLAEKM